MTPFLRLFQPGKMGNLELANRMIMAPMVTHYAQGGAVTDRMIAYYAERARGGAALLILEATYPRTVGHPGRVHIWNDSFIPGLKRLTDEVHRCGGRMAIEINPSRGRGDEADPISASNVPYPATGKIPRALPVEEIGALQEEFGRSVARAKEAGFDAVMIHGGTGYLINEFLSPRTNLRADEYGGDIRGRARLAVEMVREAKGRAGEEYPIIFRLGASERMAGGLSLEDAVAAARIIAEAGADALDVVSGVAETLEWVVPSYYLPLACNVPLAQAIKRGMDRPVSVAGRITDPRLAEEILAGGSADFIVLGRALLADPFFPQKAREGREAEIRKCLGCLRCMESFGRGVPLVCSVNPRLGREGEPWPAPKKKRVLVIGGGPAGLEAAVTAAELGHEVVLREKEKLGGQIPTASVPPGKEHFISLLDYLRGQLAQQKVKLILGRGGLPAGWRPQAVIAAIGSVPLVPGIPGMKSALKRKQALTARDVLQGKAKLGKKAVVIGGGMIGCEVAEYLAGKGRSVVLLEILPELAQDAFVWIRKQLKERLEARGVQAFVGVKEEKITSQGIDFVDRSGQKIFLKGARIVIAAGSGADARKTDALKVKGAKFLKIGDCREARRILEAVHEGYEAALRL